MPFFVAPSLWGGGRGAPRRVSPQPPSVCTASARCRSCTDVRCACVGVEVKKEGDIDVWCIQVTTDMLAAGREEFRKALAEIVRRAVENGWVDAGKAER